MKLYLIYQQENNDYDTYSAAVVCANSEVIARNIHPRSGLMMTDDDWNQSYNEWASSFSQVKARYIGEAEPEMKQGVVLSSFHAG